MKEYPKYIQAINERFNRQLEVLNLENSSKIIFYLGNPSAELLAGGVANHPIVLNGNKIMMKQRKHGFTMDEIRNLPFYLREPIAIFDNLKTGNNRSALISLKTLNGNFLVCIDFDKNQVCEFDVISSLFGKKEESVINWIIKGRMTYVNKEKALTYLFHTAPIAGVPDSSELFSAANIIKDFENPKLQKENYERITDISVIVDKYGKYTMRCKVDGQQQLSERIGSKDSMRLARGLSDKMEIAEKYFSAALSMKNGKHHSLKL